MSSDLIAIAIGLSLGVGISVAVIWPHRAELVSRYRELLGIGTQQDEEPQQPGPQPVEDVSPSTNWVAVLICSVAIVGNVVVAVITEDQLVRVVNIVSAAVFALAVSTMLIATKRASSPRHR